MTIRRVITGHDPNGSAIVVSDGRPSRIVEFNSVNGLSVTLLWETKRDGVISNGDSDPSASARSFVPEMGGANLMLVVLPPKSAREYPDFDPEVAAKEYHEKLPGLAESHEPGGTGMHKTETVDYAVVLDGEVHLELDLETVKLVKHDVVIQNGTRHAWRNKSDLPAKMLFVLLGAERKSAD